MARFIKDPSQEDSRDRGVNMVSINGGFLMAPPHLTIKNPYLKGAAEMYEDGVFVTVDLTLQEIWV